MGVAGSLACTSLHPPAPEQASPAPIALEDESADYDFLVARQLELEGQLPESLEAYRRAALKDPDAAVLQRKIAELAARQGDLSEAIEHAERAYALDPDADGVRLLLGTLYRLQKDERAADVLIGADGQPIGPDAAFLLYMIYLEADRLPEALGAAEWLVANQPDVIRGHLAVAGVYEKMDQPEEFERALRRALEHRPENLVVYRALARSRRMRGDREGEVEIYREILVHYPHHRATLVSLADALIALDRTEDAMAVLLEIEEFHSNDTRSILRLALIEYETGHYEEAARRLERVLETQPEEYGIAYFLGLILQRTGDSDAAMLAFERVPPRHERYADARTQMAAILERREQYDLALEEIERARAKETSRTLDLYAASLRSKMGDFEGAVAFLEALLEGSPDDDELLYNLGVLYGEAQRHDDALDYMQRALALNPDNPSALNYVGYTWAEKGENLEQAEAMILHALELRPDDGFITDSLGWVYYVRARALLEEGGNVPESQELLRQAARQLERAVELTGGDPVVAEHLGDVYLALNDKRRALEMYDEAIRMEPRSEEQPDLMGKFERLHRELGAQ